MITDVISINTNEYKELVAKAKELDKAGLGFSSVWYTPDFKFNPMRFICVVEQLRRQNKKYDIYYPKKSEKV